MLQQESINNLIIGLADSIIKNISVYPSAHFFVIFGSNQVVGAALNTDEDHPLSITELPCDGIACLVQFIKIKKIKLSGVVGEEISAQKFAQFYAKENSCPCKLSMHQGIYETDKIILPNHEGLNMQVGTENDSEVIEEYILGFMEECFPGSPLNQKQSQVMLDRHLNNKTLFLLKNEKGETVSMAANNRETRNTACISLVYTPEQYRKNGYGSIITALVSQKMLDSGKKYCNLFTDLLNPTSNSIYQKIGYKMIGKSKHFEFKE